MLVPVFHSGKVTEVIVHALTAASGWDLVKELKKRSAQDYEVNGKISQARSMAIRCMVSTARNSNPYWKPFL